MSIIGIPVKREGLGKRGPCNAELRRTQTVQNASGGTWVYP
jgi:hypothetical protein